MTEDIYNLKDVLKRHFNVNYTSDAETILRELVTDKFPHRNNQFKKELLTAMKTNSISTEEFNKLTDDEMETQEEVSKFLKNEIWQPLYGDEPITV